jgi:DNA polymerase-3 subunit epsilon
MNLNLKRPIAFFDLETTGLIIGKDRIVEISILKIGPDGTRSTYTRKVNPGMPIPPESTAIHGIGDADVKDEPTFKEIGKEVLEIIEDCDLAGYNSNKFDIPMLVEEFLENEFEFDVSDRKLIDVQNIFHKMEQRTLVAAYKFYCDKDLEQAHSAEADTLATFEVLEAQLERYGDQLKNETSFLHEFSNMFNAVDLAGRVVRNKQGVEVFNFGKHKGTPVKEVFEKEPSYFDWMMKGDFPRQTKQVIERLNTERLLDLNSGK